MRRLRWESRDNEVVLTWIVRSLMSVIGAATLWAHRQPWFGPSHLQRMNLTMLLSWGVGAAFVALQFDVFDRMYGAATLMLFLALTSMAFGLLFYNTFSLMLLLLVVWGVWARIDIGNTPGVMGLLAAAALLYAHAIRW